jgi:hypothetical protein
MTTEQRTQGAQVRTIFQDAHEEIVIIAPFIKVKALKLILESVPSSTHIRCVTRWLPRDIAAGASDPEILDVFEERGNFSLSLVDVLHAKLYVAGDKCLVGSSNVTLPGLGEAEYGNNIELLAAVPFDNPDVIQVLKEISRVERTATRNDAEVARRLADSLSPLTISSTDGTAVWTPRSRRPEHAYEFYKDPPKGYLASGERMLLGDVARANIQPGMNEDRFRLAIRELLNQIPLSQTLLAGKEDTTLTRADAQPYLESIAADEFSVNDLWQSFVLWMSYFYADQVMKQEIAEFALRRAQVL